MICVTDSSKNMALFGAVIGTPVKTTSISKKRWNKISSWKCKIVCVFGKKYLFFGKNQDMTILIKKEAFLCRQQNSRFDRLLQITT